MFSIISFIDDKIVYVMFVNIIILYLDVKLFRSVFLKGVVVFFFYGNVYRVVNFLGY